MLRLVVVYQHERRRIRLFLHSITRREDLVIGRDVHQVLVLQNRPAWDRLIHTLYRARRIPAHAELQRLVAQHVVIRKRVTDHCRLLEIARVKFITGNH